MRRVESQQARLDIHLCVWTSKVLLGIMAMPQCPEARAGRRIDEQWIPAEMAGGSYSPSTLD